MLTIAPFTSSLPPPRTWDGKKVCEESRQSGSISHANIRPKNPTETKWERG
jgi:hypothetical protein